MIRVLQRPWLRVVLLACIGLLAGLVTDTHAAVLPASPKPNYIRDDAKWLDSREFLTLDKKLLDYERETSSLIFVAIFPDVPPGEEMVDYTQRLFEAWKPGAAGKDNGVIFVIFASDRLMRIHTGYGMEGVLPDARCKEIIAEVVAPLLREGKRQEAVNAGVDAMISAAKGEYTGTGRTHLEGGDGGNESPLVPLLLVGGILVFVIWGLSTGAFTLSDVIFTVLGASRGSGGGWSSGGGGGGGGGFSGGGGRSGGGGASGGW